MKVPADILSQALCHHWTQSEPSLPPLEDSPEDISYERQLEFDRPMVFHDR